VEAVTPSTDFVPTSQSSLNFYQTENDLQLGQLLLSTKNQTRVSPKPEEV